MEAAQEQATDEATAHTEGQAASTCPQHPWQHQNYSLYVTDSADLVGLVAYSLYKQHKITFIESEAARTNSSACSDATHAFCRAYSQDHQVELLREKAESLLEEMTEQVLAEVTQELNREYEQKLKKALKEGMPLGKSVLHSFVGNLVTAGIIALAVWGTSANFDDLLAALKRPFSSSETVQAANAD